MKDCIFSQRVRDALSFINEEFNSDISLNEISEACNLSKYYLMRVFHRETGLTIKKYVILRRLYEAKRLMRSNIKTTTTEICFESGFGDYSNFIKQFKKYFVCSPVDLKNCQFNLRKCKIKKNDYIYLIESKLRKINKALGTHITILCKLKME